MLEGFVTNTRDETAVPEFVTKAMRGRHCPFDCFVTDKLRSHRAENAHLPFRRRERAMLRLRRTRGLQEFASVKASVPNHFNDEPEGSALPVPETPSPRS